MGSPEPQCTAELSGTISLSLWLRTNRAWIFLTKTWHQRKETSEMAWVFKKSNKEQRHTSGVEDGDLCVT